MKNKTVRLCRAVLLAAALAPAELVGQIDPENRTLLQAGASWDAGSRADISAVGFLYWNRLDTPFEGIDFNAVFAGPYLDTSLLLRDTPWSGAALGIQAGGIGWFAAPSPEYVNGNPLRNEQYRGNAVWTGLFFNQFLAEFTSYKIPLNFRISSRLEYTDYFGSKDRQKNFQLPSDPLLSLTELKLQFGGTPPDICDLEALDIHVRYILGQRSNWNSFGPIDAPYETHANFQKWIFAAGFSAPLLKDQTTGLRFSAGGGNNLDRTTAYRLGGLLTRGVESIRITGYITEEFIADEYFLVNFSHQIPLVDWRELSLHLLADWAHIRRDDERVQQTRSVAGIGTGLSLKGPWNTDLQMLYGCGLDADREKDRKGHSISFIWHKEF